MLTCRNRTKSATHATNQANMTNCSRCPFDAKLLLFILYLFTTLDVVEVTVTQVFCLQYSRLQYRSFYIPP